MSSNTTILKSVIICTRISSFCLSSSFRQRFCPVVVVCSGNIVSLLVEIFSDDTVIITYDMLTDPGVCKISSTASICFVDGTMNSSYCEWLMSVDISTFITTKIPGRIHSSWHRKQIEIVHQLYGGVTDHVQSFYVYSRKQVLVHCVKDLLHSRDAHTIMDDSVWCNVKRRKPTPVEIHPLRVENVGSNDSPITI